MSASGMTFDVDPTGSRLTIPGVLSANDEIDPTLVRLTNNAGAIATFYPAVGFNCIDWRIPDQDGELISMLHADPDVLTGGSGTRSGQPILFPFPNRIANAAYNWRGEEFHLQPAHVDSPHAMHGFCAKTAWRDYQQSGESAVTAQFQISVDAPDKLASWPGDLRLRITFELGEMTMRVTSLVTNVDNHPVPFGMGFHPYFTMLHAASVAQMRLECGAQSQWVLDDGIPTGQRRPVSGSVDLRSDPEIGDRHLDDVLTELPAFVAEADGLMSRAQLTGGGLSVQVRCDDSYHDIVVFTPGSREAVAVEPYTCPSDAVHLAESGLDVGWRELLPGQSWTGVVEYRAAWR